jgi:hypothetical protein
MPFPVVTMKYKMSRQSEARLAPPLRFGARGRPDETSGTTAGEGNAFEKILDQIHFSDNAQSRRRDTYSEIQL